MEGNHIAHLWCDNKNCIASCYPQFVSTERTCATATEKRSVYGSLKLLLRGCFIKNK